MNGDAIFAASAMICLAVVWAAVYSHAPSNPEEEEASERDMENNLSRRHGMGAYMTKPRHTVRKILSQHPDGLMGMEILKASNGALKRGGLYVVLSYMVDAGELEAEELGDPFETGAPRLRYRLAEQEER